jgi:D-inositol-3-phosphate glycosyltransferase
LRVLHVLAHGMPRMSGYAVRSHNILRAQQGAGLEVLAVTGPYYGGQAGTVEDATIDGVRYLRGWRGGVSLWAAGAARRPPASSPPT